MVVNAQQSVATAPGGPSTRPRPAALQITTDRGGRVLAGSGEWPGGVYRAGHLGEIVHARNHDLLEHVVGSLGDHGRLDHAVSVQVRSMTGWDEAAMTAAAGIDGVVWTFVPVLADPMRALGQAIVENRDLAALIDIALEPLAGSGSPIWASVHHGRAGERYRSVVACSGHDTFSRAVEAAVAGDAVCPWDTDLPENETTVPVAEFGDGIVLAGPHAGLGYARLIPILGTGGVDAACLAVWADSPGQLDLPASRLLVRRVSAAVTLAFHVEAGREGQRILATRDGMTGLWNREAFFAQLEVVENEPHTAVICADVDDFRAVNDWHGHAAGDEVLAQLASRLRHAMRPGDTIARVASDEFAILCMDVPTAEAAAVIGERVVAVCAEDIVVGTDRVPVEMSVGIATAAPERLGNRLFDAAERTMLAVKSDEDRGNYRLA